MSPNLLRNLRMDEARGLTSQTINQETLATAGEIIASVRRQGRDGLLELGRKFSDLGPDDQLVYTAEELKAARDRLPAEQRRLLERTAQRIADFAAAQRACLTDLSADIQGGRAGWRGLRRGHPRNQFPELSDHRDCSFEQRAGPRRRSDVRVFDAGQPRRVVGNRRWAESLGFVGTSVGGGGSLRRTDARQRVYVVLGESARQRSARRDVLTKYRPG